ncbi:hypothetical protein COLO4_37426 [Corchorus olitorius]|uniref:Uncharacterized protein n=1 Tax=Corchorus olitorius TaxID=93759 RepID=A0A1R3G1Z4_9ROSI|nr:hypothetical protein COLO4_37426 [Corchorus olitorius]
MVASPPEPSPEMCLWLKFHQKARLDVLAPDLEYERLEHDGGAKQKEKEEGKDFLCCCCKATFSFYTMVVVILMVGIDGFLLIQWLGFEAFSIS